MTSITLKGIPDQVIERLRERAKQERRSLNQQAIFLLERALEEKRPSFTETYQTFLQNYGPSPFDDDTHDVVFGNLRDPGPGRPLPFEEEGKAP